MRIGYEVSDVSAGHMGVGQYSLQLLKNLARLPCAPELILIDTLGLAAARRSSLEDTLTQGTYVRGRPILPLVHLTPGPWKKDYRTRRLAYAFDAHLVMPVMQRANMLPRLARWSVPREATSKIDVCHWSDTVFLRLPGVANVVTIHDTITLRNQSWHTKSDVARHKRKLHLMARYATRLITDSESSRRDIVEFLGVPPDRVDSIPLAASKEFHPPHDLHEADAILHRYGLDRGQYVFYVGTIEPRKNLVRLAAAFRLALDRSQDHTMRLVLAGKHGWLTGPIDEGLRQAGLGDRLLMPGPVPASDLPALMHGARAVAYVSLYEGFGLPPLEAMASGSAVITSNVSSLPEVVGNAGLLVDPYDVQAMADALHRLMVDDTLRAELIERGLRQASRFSWTRTAEQTMEAYQRALHRVE